MGVTIHYHGSLDDPTQLDATIHLVPEPSALVLLAIGLIGLLAYTWRKRK